jgi:hypothetical protein
MAFIRISLEEMAAKRPLDGVEAKTDAEAGPRTEGRPTKSFVAQERTITGAHEAIRRRSLEPEVDEPGYQPTGRKPGSEASGLRRPMRDECRKARLDACRMTEK